MTSGRPVDADVVVVGASLAGFRFVDALLAGGFDGSVAVIGDERHFPPIDRPPLSKGLLAGSVTVDAARLRAVDPASFDRVDLRLGVTATGLDLEHRVVSCDDGASLRYGRLVIATGSRARRTAPARELDGVVSLRGLEDAEQLRARSRPGDTLVVVGAGLIGCEVASTAASAGVRVVVVSATDLPIGRAFGSGIGAVVRGAMEAHPLVEYRAGRTAVELVGTTRVEAVVLDDGERIPADVVLFAVGGTPNTEWLTTSGVVLDGGVVTDEYLACDAERTVFALGDVVAWRHSPAADAERMEHWTHAADSAASLADNLCRPMGEEWQAYRPVSYVWSDQFGMKLQSLGRVTADFVVLQQSDLPQQTMVGVFLDGDTVVGGALVNSPRALATVRRLVAARASSADARARLDTRVSA